MKILITGATGLVGNELTALLLQNGVTVHYLTTSKTKIISQSNYQGFYWNPAQGIIDENCFLGVDTIIHLAGANIAKRWTAAYKQEIIESRILSSNLIFKVLKANPHQVKQIVSASGIAIYPNSPTTVYTENSASIDNGFLGNVVIKWEESVDKFKLLNIKVCKLRTGVVFSKKGGALSEMLKPIQLGLGSSYGDGKQIQSWIHIHDLTALYYYAVQHSWEGVYNAAAPITCTNKELVKTIAKILKKPLFMPSIPKFVFALLLGEMHELLFSNQNVSAQKVLEEGFVFQYPTIEKALTDIFK